MAARVLIALLLATGSLWVFSSETADACQPFRGSFEQAMGIGIELSDQIFIGRVVIAKEPERDHFVRVFDVERYLKGQGPRQVSMRIEGPPCRPEWNQEGATYIVGLPRIRLDDLSQAERERRVSYVEVALLAEYGALGSFSDDPISPRASAVGIGAAVALGLGLLVGVRRLAGR